MNRKDIFVQVQQIVEDINGTRVERIKEESSFALDLDCDSLDKVEIIMEIEDTFDFCITDEEAENIVTVKDAVDYIEKRLKTQEEQ